MANPAFEADYTRAREVGMESMADDLLVIADDDAGDMLPDGKPNHANVQRARLMVDTRWRLMQSLASRTFGDKATVEHKGTVTHTVTTSDRERMRRLATFMLEDRDAGALIEGTAEPVAPDSTGQDAGPGEPETGARSDDI
jgi:hypothetical protein